MAGRSRPPDANELADEIARVFRPPFWPYRAETAGVLRRDAALPRRNHRHAPDPARRSAARYDALLPAGGPRYTFPALEHGARVIARGLMAIGVEHGERVVIWATNIPE